MAAKRARRPPPRLLQDEPAAAPAPAALGSLPPALLQKVLAHLDPKQQGQAACVSPAWSQAVETLAPALYHYAAAGDAANVLRLVTRKPAARGGLDVLHLSQRRDHFYSRFIRETALHAAAGGGHAEAVAVLAAAGCSLDVVDSAGATPLLRAVRLKHPAVVRRLLLAGAATSPVDGDGLNALLTAVTYASPPEIVIELLSSGASTEAVDRDGNTALMRAVVAGQIALVEALLHAGAAVNHTNATGKSALAQAVSTWAPARVQDTLVEKLLAAGGDPRSSGNSGVSVLMRAAWLGSSATVDRILAALDPLEEALCATSAQGFTPMMYAAYGGNVSAMQRLHDSGASIAGDIGSRALILTASRHHLAAMDWLMAHGAVLSTTDTKGFPVLLPAVARRDLLAINILIGAGASADAVNFDGRRPLELAARHGFADVIDVLLRAMANQRPADLMSAIEHARENDHLDALARLLREPEAFEDPECTDLHYALVYAAVAGRLDIVDALLGGGVPPHARVDLESSPLVSAAEGGHLYVVNRLLVAGVSPDEVGDEGETALEAARRQGRSRIVARLLEAGATE